MEDKIENKEGEGGRQDISSEGKPRGVDVEEICQAKTHGQYPQIGPITAPPHIRLGRQDHKEQEKTSSTGDGVLVASVVNIAVSESPASNAVRVDSPGPAARSHPTSPALHRCRTPLPSIIVPSSLTQAVLCPEASSVHVEVCDMVRRVLCRTHAPNRSTFSTDER